MTKLADPFPLDPDGVHPDAVPKLEVDTGAKIPVIGLGTFGSDKVAGARTWRRRLSARLASAIGTLIALLSTAMSASLGFHSGRSFPRASVERTCG